MRGRERAGRAAAGPGMAAAGPGMAAAPKYLAMRRAVRAYERKTQAYVLEIETLTARVAGYIKHVQDLQARIDGRPAAPAAKAMVCEKCRRTVCVCSSIVRRRRPLVLVGGPSEGAR